MYTVYRLALQATFRSHFFTLLLEAVKGNLGMLLIPGIDLGTVLAKGFSRASSLLTLGP